jgi:N-acetyl-anhydromuramyl-L-alanine amidase AmpD
MRILNFTDFFFEAKTVDDIYAIGAKGEEVKTIQQKLIDLGFLKISAPTGNYQEQTKKAVEAFQRILYDYPNSFEATDIEKYIGRIEAK